MKEQIEKMAARLEELYPHDFIEVTSELMGFAGSLRWRFTAIAMPREAGEYNFQTDAATMAEIETAIDDIQTIDMRLDEVLRAVSAARTVA